MKSPGGRGGRGVVLLIGLRCPVVKDLLDVRDIESLHGLRHGVLTVCKGILEARRRFPFWLSADNH